jgi:hypothetical protein
MKPDRKLIAAFDDLISEEGLMKKLSYTKDPLRRMGYKGLIKYWYSIKEGVTIDPKELSKFINEQMEKK